MTEENAEKIATVLLTVAAAGAAFYILKTPSLRRLVWQAARNVVMTAGPAWVAAEAKRGWEESENPGRQPHTI